METDEIKYFTIFELCFFINVFVFFGHEYYNNAEELSSAATAGDHRLTWIFKSRLDLEYTI